MQRLPAILFKKLLSSYIAPYRAMTLTVIFFAAVFVGACPESQAKFFLLGKAKKTESGDEFHGAGSPDSAESAIGAAVGDVGRRSTEDGDGKAQSQQHIKSSGQNGRGVEDLFTGTLSMPLNVMQPLKGTQEGLQRLAVPLEKLREPVGRLEAPISNVGTSVDKLRKPLSELQKPLEELKEPIGELKSPLKDVSSNISSLRTPINELQKPIAELKQPLTDLQSPVQGLQKPISNLSAPISGLSEPLAKVSGSLEGVENGLVGLKEEINGIKTTIEKIVFYILCMVSIVALMAFLLLAIVLVLFSKRGVREKVAKFIIPTQDSK